MLYSTGKGKHIVCLKTIRWHCLMLLDSIDSTSFLTNFKKRRFSIQFIFSFRLWPRLRIVSWVFRYQQWLILNYKRIRPTLRALLWLYPLFREKIYPEISLKGISKGGFRNNPGSWLYTIPSPHVSILYITYIFSLKASSKKTYQVQLVTLLTVGKISYRQINEGSERMPSAVTNTIFCPFSN